MKTLALVFVILFVSLPVFSQRQRADSIQTVNGWKYLVSYGSWTDSSLTRSFFAPDGQVFGTYGATKTMNRAWYIQSGWTKRFSWNNDIVVPDTLAIGCRIVSTTTNVIEVRLRVGIQDSMARYYSGVEAYINLNGSWQEFKFDMNAVVKTFMRRFNRLYLSFLVVSLDSGYVGANVVVRNLRGIDDTLGVIIYDHFGTTGVSETGEIPSKFTLGQNYPNPFNPSTTIRFSILQRGHVNLRVFNLLGQEVATLVNDKLEIGSYETVFNASGLPSGTYFYKLQVGANVEVKKMVFIK